MTNPISEPSRWLYQHLTDNYGRSSETYVYAAGRRAGLKADDIRRARRELGVEVWGKWWRLPRPPNGSTPIPSPMPNPHPWPRAEAGGHV
jgi:hypothetical protein